MSLVESASFRYGWVLQADPDPIQVRLDGDSTPLDFAPTALVPLVEGDKVLVVLYRSTGASRKAVVLGKVGGTFNPQDPSFDVEVTAPSLVTTGNITAGNDFHGDAAYLNTYRFSTSDLFWEAVNGTDYVGLLTAGGNAGRMKVGGLTIGTSYANDNAPTAGLYVEGASVLDGEVTSLGIYNRTATFTANVGVATSPAGGIYRITSSQRYKVAVKAETVTDEAILALQPKSYIDKAQFIATQGKPEQAGLPRYLGLIAEDVAQIDGLKDLLVTYANVEGQGRQPDAVNYDRLAVALVPVIQRLLVRVADLEARLP